MSAHGHSSEEIARRLDQRVQIVAGKGGVGRTSVACAMALRLARSGLRTLLLEVNAPDSAAQALGVSPALDIPREVENNLWLCRMTPEGSLKEYALMVLKFKALYKLVFENQLVKYLLRSIPSLSEFTMLGKAWYHTTETISGGAEKYQRIVIDAPATGHSVTFLAGARTVTQISPPGIMRNAAEKMAQMVETASMHLVTIPEEMPINEALELSKAAQERLHCPLGISVMNKVLPPFLNAAELSSYQQLKESSSEQLAPFLKAAQYRLDQEYWQNQQSADYLQKLGIPGLEISDLGPAIDWPGLLDTIIEALDEAAGTQKRAADGSLAASGGAS